MAITAKMVKDLRDTTGVGMMDAKKALIETNGDFEDATDWLRQKGLAKAQKKSGRIAAEGLIGIKYSNNSALLIEANCETDFVARNEEFQNMINNILDHSEGKNTLNDILNTNIEGRNVDQILIDKVSSIGENISIRRMKKISGNNIDIVLLNNGGIRSIISKGDISEKTAFELMPFENSIVVLELNGKSINKMIDYLRIVKLQHPIRGLQIKLNDDYSLNDANINGQKIKPNKKYYVATTDYLLDGGDKMYFLSETTKTIDINYKMRDVLIDYFKKNDTIKLATDNRFIRIK